MTPETRVEHGHDHDPLDPSDDYAAHFGDLENRMARADALLAASRTRELTDREKQELPRLVAQLRRLLKVQMAWNGRIARLDAEDGSYDNADTDNALRLQMARLRDLNTDTHRLWGTRTVRKVSAWITEDLPNWFSVKWHQLKDHAVQFLKVAGVVGAIGAAGAVGGYALAYGGLTPGLSALGTHLSRYVLSPVGGAVTGLFGRLFGARTAPAAS